jgi:hypothetical protein
MVIQITQELTKKTELTNLIKNLILSEKEVFEFDSPKRNNRFM